jgi:hypothetical protein
MVLWLSHCICVSGCINFLFLSLDFSLCVLCEGIVLISKNDHVNKDMGRLDAHVTVSARQGKL